MDNQLVPIVTVPEVATVVDIREEIADVRTFYFTFDRPEIERAFRIRSGQFIMCTVFGAGSLPFLCRSARRTTGSISRSGRWAR